jgi:hypothetical protein
MINKMLVGMGVLFATAGTAAAQSFEAEIDCGDVDSEPGERVPYTIRLEEQAFDTHMIELTVEVSPPGRPDRTIFSRTITLGPNEDRDLDRFFRLPIMAPLGDYDLRLTADDGTLVVNDGCSFDVI